MTRRQPDGSPTPSFPIVAFAAWASLVLAAYLGCFLIRYHPSVGHVGAALSRLPFVPGYGVLYLPVLLVSAAQWAIAVGAGMVILRRAGYTTLSLAERAVFGGALGMGIFSLGTFFLGTISGGPAWLLRVLLVLFVVAMGCLGTRELIRAAAEGARGLRTWWRGASRGSIALVVLAGIVVLLALVRANVPVFADYDALEYHLAAPAQWSEAGRIFFMRDVVYTNFPLNVEMLYLLPMSCLGSPTLGAAVGLQVGIGFVVLTAAAIAACGRRLDSPAAGRAGAAIFLTTPLLAELATLNSYLTELPLTAYSFLSLFAFLLLRRAASAGRPSPAMGARWRYAVLCGAMAGLAMGCKYPAVVFVLAPILAFILAGGVIRPALWKSAILSASIVGLMALMVASPWFVRNAVNTGNPVYPLLHETFGSWNWSAEQAAKFTKAHLPSDAGFLALGARFWRFAIWRTDGMPASPVLILFALVPIALAERRSARPVFYAATLFLAFAAIERFAPGQLANSPMVAYFLSAATALMLVTAPAFLLPRGDLIFLPLHAILWFLAWYALTHRLDRFLDPVTAAVALLGGAGIASMTERWAKRLAYAILGGGLACTAFISVLFYAPLIAEGLGMPTDEFLREVNKDSTYCQPVMDAINDKLAPEAVVLFLGESRTLYCRRRALASTVFDRSPIDRLLDSGPRGDSARRVRDGLRELGVTHMYVNWAESDRLANSYGYHYEGILHRGLPDDVYRRLFEKMREAGHLKYLVQIVRRDEHGRPQDVFALYELQ